VVYVCAVCGVTQRACRWRFDGTCNADKEDTPVTALVVHFTDLVNQKIPTEVCSLVCRNVFCLSRKIHPLCRWFAFSSGMKPGENSKPNRDDCGGKNKH
jgi:hypothetical protein